MVQVSTILSFGSSHRSHKPANANTEPVVRPRLYGCFCLGPSFSPSRGPTLLLVPPLRTVRESFQLTRLKFPGTLRSGTRTMRSDGVASGQIRGPTRVVRIQAGPNLHMPYDSHRSCMKQANTKRRALRVHGVTEEPPVTWSHTVEILLLYPPS